MLKTSPIDIVLCSDRHQFVAIPALIRSVIRNTEQPAAISFHLVVQPGETDEIQAMLRRQFPRPAFVYEIREFGPLSPVLDRYIRSAKGEARGSIPYRASAINCSRFYLCDIFPDLDKIIYLDVDTIVQGDVAELFTEADLERHEIAAASIGSWEVYAFEKQSTYFQEVDFSRPGFNAGVFVARLVKWREKGVVARLEAWMEMWSDHQDELCKPLFCFGSQTVMNAVFHGNFQVLQRKWNIWGLGFGDDIPESDLQEAGILHWTGPGKPWTAQGLYKKYWQEYAATSSSGGGDAERTS